ncbi:MAG TPA: glycoside hydrolase family 27 protein [bacterium]|nr:glycoside hydrolase family 27 protein [bacterium]
MADGLAKTPPMGWNSWNAFSMNIDEKSIKTMADLMVSSGLKDAGYIYLNLDDGWAAGRDFGGTIQPDRDKFPSGMKALGDYIHSKGLKFGIYTCAGNMTCGKLTGSRGFEKQDMKMYAAWGVDYVKIDWCNTEGLDSKTQYALFRDGIRESGRPMILSICNWGVDKPWEWGKQMGQLWRTAGDLLPCWDCKTDWGGGGLVIDLDKQIGLEPYAGPGGWNDPDMLQVGNGSLTPDECRVQFSLWAVLAAPLIAGNDLRKMTPEVKEILLNKEVIAVDQDPLGKQGTRVKQEGPEREVWARSLSGGEWAVCLLNRSSQKANIQVRWEDLGLKPAKTVVRDLWDHQDLGDFETGFGADVPSHGVVFIRIKPESI